jgi:hypothetical protein
MLGKKNKTMETNALYTIWRYKAPVFKLYQNNFDDDDDDDDDVDYTVSTVV